MRHNINLYRAVKYTYESNICKTDVFTTVMEEVVAHLKHATTIRCLFRFLMYYFITMIITVTTSIATIIILSSFLPSIYRFNNCAIDSNAVISLTCTGESITGVTCQTCAVETVLYVVTSCQ